MTWRMHEVWCRDVYRYRSGFDFRACVHGRNVWLGWFFHLGWIFGAQSLGASCQPRCSHGANTVWGDAHGGETATLDRLFKGRLILSLGLGAAEDLGFDRVGEPVDRKVRAELLDESVDILNGLWTGQPFTYEGNHYRLRDAKLSIRPVQRPRIPIWVVGAWPRIKSMRRVLRCDGLIPAKMTANGVSDDIKPEDLREMSAFVRDKLGNTPLDSTVEGETPGDDKKSAAQIVSPFREAGATWWLESIAATPYRLGGIEGVRARIAQGPPRLE